MKKFPFAMLALSAGLVLAGCSDPVAPASSSSSDTGASSGSSSSSTPAPVEVTINVSEDIPGEFAISGSFDLDDFVTVTGVTSFDVEVVSGPVAVNSDHVVTASGYGEYLIRISAGGESTDISGAVVSEDKIKVAAIVGNLSDNWTAKATLGSYDLYTFRTEHYYAVGTYSSDETYYQYEGIVEAPDGNNYAFAYAAALDHSQYTALQWQNGVDTDMEDHGMLPLELPASSLEEIYGPDGNPMGYFLLDDQAVIAPFVLGATSTSWGSFMNSYGCEQFLVYLKEDGSLLFEAVNRYFYFSGLSISIGSVGTSKVDLLDAWYAEPVYPGALDVSLATDLINASKTGKNYTMTVKSYWRGTWGGEYDCSPNYEYNGIPLLFRFTSTIYVDGDAMYTDVSRCETDVPDAYKENGLVTNMATYYAANPNGGADTTYGTITRATSTAEESVAWGSTTNDPRGPAPFESRWTTGALTEEVLKNANFRYETATGGGYPAYIFDNISDGGVFQKALFEMGGRGGYYVYNNMGMWTDLRDYITNVVIVSGSETDADGNMIVDTVEYQGYFNGQYGSTSVYTYYYIVTLSDVGTTTIPHSPVVAA